jgi:hypothetical protein
MSACDMRGRRKIPDVASLIRATESLYPSSASSTFGGDIGRL